MWRNLLHMWCDSSSVKAVNLVKNNCYSNGDNEFFLRDCFLLAHPVYHRTNISVCNVEPLRLGRAAGRPCIIYLLCWDYVTCDNVESALSLTLVLRNRCPITLWIFCICFIIFSSFIVFIRNDLCVNLLKQLPPHLLRCHINLVKLHLHYLLHY